MLTCKRFLALLLVTALLLALTGCAQTSYAVLSEEYNALYAQLLSGEITEEEYLPQCAQLFRRMARGSSSEAAQLAKLLKEMSATDAQFEDDQVFEIARGYAVLCDKLSQGEENLGIQGLSIKQISRSQAKLSFAYLDEMWYNVEMLEIGDQWVTGEFTDPYEGEIGQYLMLLQVHDASPSLKFAEKYITEPSYTLNVPLNGKTQKMTMKIMENSDHGYDIYIGSDCPFTVEEQQSLRLPNPKGTINIVLTAQ